jgi:hypothetical protein
MTVVKISDLNSADDLAFAELTPEEQAKVTGGGAVPLGLAGAASGFLGSLAGSATGALETGSFGFPDLRRAAATGLATGTVGATLGSITGAGLAKDS